MNYCKNFINNLYNAGKKLLKENYTYHASALAFSTVLSIVPLFSLFIAIVAFSPFATKAVVYIQKFLMENFLPTSISGINMYLNAFISQSVQLSTLSIIFLFLTLVSLFLTIRTALNCIWEKTADGQSYTSIKYWLKLIGICAIGGGLFLANYILSLLTANLGEVQTYLGFAFSIVMNIVIFTLFYICLPNYKIHIGNGIAGAIVATILFELTKRGFGFCINHFSSYGNVYGALAIVPVFFVWVYLFWLIVLYGALFVNVSQSSVHKKPHPT